MAALLFTYVSGPGRAMPLACQPNLCLYNHQVHCTASGVEKRMATGFVCHELYMWHNTWNWAQVFRRASPCSRANMPKTPKPSAASGIWWKSRGCWTNSRSSSRATPRGRTRPLPYAGAYRPHQADERGEWRRRQHPDTFRQGQLSRSRSYPLAARWRPLTP